ncbi:MAG: glycosyltransferase family 2 protein [Acidobacteriia bacterium]|nr:glycosyltransferase family 2 protein [Terriglobia bacterium]
MQNNESVSVTAIVPCRNEIRHIRAFLDSVMRQELTGIDLEIVVADGMSGDGTREVLEEYERNCPALRVIDNPKRIVSTGLNAAIRQARGEIIVRMDAHTEYAPDYIRTCVQVLDESRAGNVGGPALTRAKGYLAEAIARGFHSKFVSGGARFHDPRYEGYVDTVTYGCWRKSTLLRLGLFDERLYRSQDDELNIRIRSAGGKIWQSPRIKSWYWPRATLAALFRQYFQYGFWKVAVIRKHRKPASWRNLVPGACLLLALVLLGGMACAWMAGSAYWQSGFLKILVSLAGLYFAVSIVAALHAGWRGGWRIVPVLPVVFATYHLSYALGFLLAIAFRPAAWDRPTYLRRILTAITR